MLSSKSCKDVAARRPLVCMWFIVLCKLALVFKSVNETLADVTIQMKTVEQQFHVVLIISRAPAAQSGAP